MQDLTVHGHSIITMGQKLTCAHVYLSLTELREAGGKRLRHS